ncbi:membrane insertase OXA1/ALB3/YidC, partial [Cercophora newfieldiana]
LTTTQHLFTELHHITGTPWFLTIPLIALSINLIARLPVSIYTRRILIRRAKLAPLFQAWNTRHGKEITLNPQTGALPIEGRRAELKSRMKATAKRIYKDFGVQEFKTYTPLAIFPVWLIGIESLRRLCGGPRGLIGTLVFGPDDKTTSATGEAAAASSNPADAVSVTDIAQDIVPPGADPSLATGGCLWFPDLMAADPLHILPFAISAVLMLNILPASQRSLAGMRRLFVSDTNQSGVVETQTSTRLTRAFLIMALAIGPVTMDLPAALHLYWLSSSTITFIQSEILEKRMPLPKFEMKPCSRQDSVYLRPYRP